LQWQAGLNACLAYGIMEYWKVGFKKDITASGKIKFLLKKLMDNGS
jgi:hypothetical protein